MALVECPDCGRNVSDSAPTCVGCGRPISQGQLSAKSGNSTAERAASWICQRCGSTSFKKFSLLFEEQRSNSVTNTRGAAVGISSSGGIGGGIGSAETKGVITTELGRRVAPPDRAALDKPDSEAAVAKAMLLGVAIGVLAYWGLDFGFFSSVGIALLAMFGMSIVDSIRSDPEQTTRYKKAVAEWDKKYMCLQCGAEVAAEKTGSGTVLTLREADVHLDQLLRSGARLQAVQHLVETKGMSISEASSYIDRRPS